MRVYELQSEMEVPKSVKETFEFFENPANLSRITPPWLNFVIRTPGPVEMKAGAEIDYTIRWFGLPLPWKTIISEYEPPFHFVDTQERGPYRLWVHRHTFHPTEEGTLVGDHVRYALPFGPLGSAAHAVMVRRQLREIFSYRQRALAEILGGWPLADPDIQPAAVAR